MKQIYFACSIRGGRSDAKLYAELVELIKKQANVLSEIFANGNLTDKGSTGLTTAIYRKDITWLQQADAVIAEVTNPSLGVGYEIAKAEEWGKPVLALFRSDSGKSLSAMVDGSPKTKVYYYSNVASVSSVIQRFIRSIQ